MLSDKIVVVDDDPRMISSIRRVLNEYEMIGFQNGNEALAYLEKPNDVSLVLLDIFMREMDGISLLTEIKKMNKDMPVIIMTGHGSMDLAVQALRCRADDFIEKPFDVHEIKDRVKALLKEKSYMLKSIEGENERIARIKRFIQRNYTNVSLEHIAGEMCLSVKYLSRLFKEKSQGNFRDYKLGIKMDKAKSLLKNSSYSVNQIAYEMGYQNPESFMRIFKRMTQSTPSQYRKKFQRKRKS